MSSVNYDSFVRDKVIRVGRQIVRPPKSTVGEENVAAHHGLPACLAAPLPNPRPVARTEPSGSGEARHEGGED